MSKLYYIQSPMSGSKSAMLLMKAHSFEERGIPFICLKPTVDNRDGVDVIKSRIGIQRECVSVEINDDIYRMFQDIMVNLQLQLIDTPKWILVDESQFLTAIQVEQLSKIVDDYDINVMCYGLRTDFRTQMFEGSKRLMELADDIDELKISCSCGRKAIINARIGNDGKIVTDGEQILIGGNDRYVSLCRRCYNKAIAEREGNNNVNL